MASYVNKRAQGVSDKVLKSLRLTANFVDEVQQKRNQEAEADEELGNRFSFAGYKKGQATRKEKRKMAKKEKKIKKQQHHLRKVRKVLIIKWVDPEHDITLVIGTKSLRYYLFFF